MLKSRGFTILELLVVISVLGLAATFAITAVNSAREGAKLVIARADLTQYQKAIEFLIEDTGKWPNSCDVGHQLQNCSNGNNDLSPILEPCVALLKKPELGGPAPGPGGSCSQCHDPLVGSGQDLVRCVWTQPEIDSWKGPYVSAVPETDPWGTYYYFDMDYEPYKVQGGGSCPGQPAEPEQAVIVSYGPDQMTGNAEGCDDIFVKLF